MTATTKPPRHTARSILSLASVAGLLALSACSATDQVSSSADQLWSSITGDETENGTPDTTATATTESTPATPAPPPAPAAPSGDIAAPVPAVAATGTAVGQRALTVGTDLQRLGGAINQHNAELQNVRTLLATEAQAYYALVRGINTRLRSGVASTDPQITAQLRQAQAALDHLALDATRLHSLATEVASDVALAAYVDEEIKAAGSLQGAVAEDRRQLDALQATVGADAAVVQRLAKSIADENARQNQYVSNERGTLAVLAAGVATGTGVGEGVATPRVRAATVAPPDIGATPAAQRHALVTIRFDRPNVPYQQALYTAVSRTLQVRPNAMFELVAVSPSAGSAAQVSINADAAKRNAQNVMLSLANMGLPAERLAVSSVTSARVKSSEVRIFVR